MRPGEIRATVNYYSSEHICKMNEEGRVVALFRPPNELRNLACGIRSRKAHLVFWCARAHALSPLMGCCWKPRSKQECVEQECVPPLNTSPLVWSSGRYRGSENLVVSYKNTVSFSLSRSHTHTHTHTLLKHTHLKTLSMIPFQPIEKK